MHKVITLEECLRLHPDFTPEWSVDQYGNMENPQFGKVERVVVCDEEGKPLYDQYRVQSNVGAIILPHDIKDGKRRVGLVKIERHIPEQIGYEAPRGVKEYGESTLKAARREFLEETGLNPSEEVTLLGSINPNTSWYKTNFPVVAIAFDDLNNMQGHSTKGRERITQATPFTYQEITGLIKKKELLCGLTKAALFEFGCFMPDFYAG